MKMRLLIVTVVTCLLSLTALASPMNYNDPAHPPGATVYTNISENSITDLFSLYGSPGQIGDILSFAPTAFASYSGSNSADLTSGTLKFKASAPVGEYFTMLSISEVGDFAIIGLGTAQAYVSGLITVRDLDTGAVLFGSLTVAPSSLVLHPPGNGGTFLADIVLPFSGIKTKNIEVVFNNILATAAEPLSAAMVQPTAIDIRIAHEVPEPATMLLLGIGAIAITARQKLQCRSAKLPSDIS